MKTVFRAAVAAMLLTLPLAAQISWISLRIEQQGGSSCLLHIGKATDPLYKGLQKLTEAKELADIGLVFESVQAATPRYESLAKALGLARSSTWALTDKRGRRLLQGSQMPTELELKDALQAAGVKNPIKEMRDFLKQHPGHLEARAELMARLRAVAERRTKQALRLNIKPSIPTSVADLTNDLDWTDIYRLQSRSAVVDTSPMEGKQLEPEEDTLIWGAYAQELNETFASGDWRLMPMPRVQSLTSIEVCSPLMALTYRRNLSKIEDYLEEFPSSADLWKYYGWASAIAKRKSARAVIERLVEPPRVFSRIESNVWEGSNTFGWPVEEAISLLVAEEREKENWGALADTLIAMWPKLRISMFGNAMLYYEGTTGTMAQIAKAFREVVWQDYLCPLLESLIKANRAQEAEAILLDAMNFINSYYYKEIPTLSKEFQGRAADLAKSCGNSDLRDKWAALEMPEEKDIIIDDVLDLRRKFIGVFDESPMLIVALAESVIDPKDPLQLKALEIDRLKRGQLAELEKGQLIDWRLGIYYYESPRDMPDWFIQKYDLRRGNEDKWTLFDPNFKVLAQGKGLPSAAALLQALEASSLETPASVGRRFIKEHPSHSEARELLLRELKRVAEQKTKDTIGADADSSRLLSDQDDHAIWWEYSQIFRLALSSALERGRITSNIDDFTSAQFIHSPLMKSLAHAMLPQVEACMQRQPTDVFLWANWVSLSGLNEYRPFGSIIETLTLAPMSDPSSDLPPPRPRSKLLEQYQSSSNWQGVLDVQEWRWEGMRDGLKSDPTALTGRLWERNCQPMLEAYLRLGREREARDLFEFWALYAPSREWVRIKPIAAAVAEKCGKSELAERWKK
ncbi:MAG: hypothetical protein LBC63_03835 [Holophagales bacterium]|jgi:hypothetical protein|nr:hypothetical protein [Holophagales bacterium]